jgi:hypothetical protein
MITVILKAVLAQPDLARDRENISAFSTMNLRGGGGFVESEIYPDPLLL